MKKLVFLLAFALVGTLSAISQEAPLEQYVGKYIFPEGNPVPWVEVKLVDGVLVTDSPQGAASLARVEADLFSIVEYNGLAQFKRNGDGKVVGVKVSVMGLEMEGTRENLKLKAIPFSPLNPMKWLLER